MKLASYKTGIQHAETNITTSGGGTVPGEFSVMRTDTGARTLSGAEQATKSEASTGDVCEIGDIIKYINLFMQVAPRSTATTPAESMGSVEWAFMMVKESETSVPITQLGTETLATICTRMYRNECIYTGAIPIGLNQPNNLSVVIKVPKFKQKIRIGDEWRFVHWFRSWDSTNDDLNNVKTVKSCIYKSYS